MGRNLEHNDEQPTQVDHSGILSSEILGQVWILSSYWCYPVHVILRFLTFQFSMQHNRESASDSSVERVQVHNDSHSSNDTYSDVSMSSDLCSAYITQVNIIPTFHMI